MSRTNVYVGSSVERVEDLRFLRGRGQYIGDLEREGQWHAAVVRSSVAHGRIVSIHTEGALGIPGVHAVLSTRDIGTIPKIHLRTNLPSYAPFAQPVIAEGRVRYVGEPVALVLAESPGCAEDGAEAVEVDIEPLPVLMNWQNALESQAPLIDGTSGNVAGTCTASRGEVDAAFREAPYKRREQFRVHRHAAMPMETRGLLAVWDAATSHLTIYGAAKSPFFSRKSLSRLLDIPEASVDCIECDVGGGFGARGEVYPEDFLVAFAARKYAKPVKWIEDRREHFLAMNHSRDIECDLEIACARDGTVVGLRGTAYVDIGAYARPTCITAIRNVTTFMTGGYRVPNVHIRSFATVSNKTPSGVYRGPGRFESCFFLERMLDMAAEDLGIDRIELRRRNLLTEPEMPYQLSTIEPTEAPSGALDSGHYPSTLEACARNFDWNGRLEMNGRLIDGRYHGIGASCFVEGGATGPRENARIEIEADGSVTAYVGSSALGQGLETVLSQIAADALELPMSKIRILHGSTTLLHEGFGSSASRSTVMGGNAIVVAANALIDAFRLAAAARFEVPSQDIVVSNAIASAPDGRTLSFSDVAELGLKADGTFANNRQTYTYGTAMAHVAVDAKTGHVQLLEYQVVDDVGRAINPLTLHGQVIGAAVQGLGGVFSEELVYDENGQLLVGSFVDYLTPLATDYPNLHAMTMELYPSPNNPLGAKGAGEGGIIPVAGAVGNAVAAALAPLGVKITALPLSPFRIWDSIQKSGGNGASTRPGVT